MTRRTVSAGFVAMLGVLALVCSVPVRASEETPHGVTTNDFANPPRPARLRAYWWWLNGNVTKAAITRDLEEMAAKGFGGALICDAGGAEQDGNARVPHGPDFFSPEWRELYKHALREADRLGLEMSLNIQSGWNLGGPMVKAEDAPKKLVWSETRVKGPAKDPLKLPEPKHPPQFYRDVAVIAYPVKASSVTRRPILNWDKKALIKALSFSAPDTSPLLQELPAEPGEEDTHAGQVVDLTDKMDADGTLRWEAPPGEWEILRFGGTLNDHCRVSTCSDGWQGYAIDPFDAGAFRRYWDAVVEPLIADAGPLAGRALKYLHTDSWEVEVANWTPTLRQEFRARRGYDLLPYLPVIAGRIVDSRPVSNRFLNDFRRTMGDLAIDNHYRLFVEGAHRHGLLIHPESGGPHAVPVDAQQCLGMDDAPMSEFWAWSWRHRVGDENRFFVKQPASAAHAYGHKLVLAEGFTTIGPHWQETLWDNLKPAFDKALCEGLNLLFWHAFVCSPAEMGLPGQQYFAGTHLNPNVTWWSKSAPFFDYLNRCQYLLQQGLFVADVAYYYGDHVPNFAQLKKSDPARILPGYDYDVVTEEVILTRMSVRDGRLVLPDGMSYRVLVLPDRPNISLPVLRKLKDLVAAGATVIGPKPQYPTGLADFPKCDEEVTRLAAELWGDCDGKTVTEHRLGVATWRGRPALASRGHPGLALPSHNAPEVQGQDGLATGRIFWGKTARDVLRADGVRPDFEFACDDPNTPLDYIHRRDGQTEIYFVANRSTRSVQADCTFRVTGKQPELWDPITGRVRSVPVRAYKETPDGVTTNGHTTLPLDFAPCGSIFVVFRQPAGTAPDRSESRVYAVLSRLKAELRTLPGPWTVRFDPNGGGPGSVPFPQLVSWTQRPEEGIKFYSGTAAYETSFDLPESLRDSRKPLVLDLGKVKELAEVRLNGRNLGVLWAPPFRVDVTDAIKATGNRLQIEVVNFWPNRIIGDQSLPPEKRFTRTNIRKLTKDTPLIESGLLGPVRIGTMDNR